MTRLTSPGPEGHTAPDECYFWPLSMLQSAGASQCSCEDVVTRSDSSAVAQRDHFVVAVEPGMNLPQVGTNLRECGAGRAVSR